MTNALNLLIGPCAAIILTQFFLLIGREDVHQTFGYSLGSIGILFILIGLPMRLGSTIAGGIICLILSCLILFQ